MAYNQKEWLAKMDKAKSTDEITALVMELPDRGPAIPEDGPEFSTTERRQTSKPSTSTTPAEKTRLARARRLCYQQHHLAETYASLKGGYQNQTVTRLSPTSDSNSASGTAASSCDRLERL